MYPGLKTTSKTRPLMISKFEEYMLGDYPTIRSNRLIEEMKTFVWKTPTRAEHMSGFHDDLIFATMFAFWTRDTAIRVYGNQNEKQSSMVSSFDVKKQSAYSSGHANQNDNQGDYSWLY